MRALIGVLLVLGAAQESVFESADYGIRLKIPSGWNIDAARDAKAILKLSHPGEGAVRPEFLLYEVAMPDVTTLAQYKEPYRQLLQRSFRETRFLDDQPSSVAGRPGFVFTLSIKDAADVPIGMVRGLYELSPRRFLAIDLTFPKAQEEAFAKAHAALLATVELIHRRDPPGVVEGAKVLAGALPKLPPATSSKPWEDELEVAFGDKIIGNYSVSLKPAEREGHAGLETKAATVIDLGAEGRVETRTTGFLSDDLTFQTVEVDELKTAKDRRVQSFWGRTVLQGREARIERRINGERSTLTVPMPELALLAELAEHFQSRLVETKGQSALPALGVFDNEPSWMRIEQGGLNQMKAGESLVDVYVTFQLREGAALMTYWYDKDRRVMRVTTGGQGLVIRRKK